MSAVPSFAVKPETNPDGLTDADFRASMGLQPVLTKDVQAGLPIEYIAACRALAACQTIDEAKHWRDKAEALSAWARIYKSDTASLEARRLKLHAYRRMGQLASEIQPTRLGAVTGAGIGAKPGVPALLVSKGLRIDQANIASAAMRMPQQKFDLLIASAKPPSPSALLYKWSEGSVSDAWKTICTAHGGNCLSGFRKWCRDHNAAELGRGLSIKEREKARALVDQSVEWLLAFSSALRRADSGDD